MKGKALPPLYLPSLSNTFSFTLVALGAAVYQAVYSFAQTALLANVHYVMCCRSDPKPLASGQHQN